MKCTNCGTELMAGAKFCFMCGEKAEDVCPACGTKKAAPEAKFCMMCGHKFDQAAAAQPATPAQPTAAANCAPKLPAEMRPSYSNYQTFANWAGYTNKYGAGNPDHHYLIKRYYKGSSLLEVTENGADAKEIKNLPFDSENLEYLFWANGKLWVTELDYKEAYNIYSMDPDTYEFTHELDLSAFVKKGEHFAPYITRSAIYFGFTDSKKTLMRWDMEKQTLTTVIHAPEFIIASIGDETVWADIVDADGYGNDFLIDATTGNATKLQDHPEFKEVLERIAYAFANPYSELESYIRLIKYIDFSEQTVYFDDIDQNGYACDRAFSMNFDGSRLSTIWEGITNWDKVNRHSYDREITSARSLWYHMYCFDGRHAFGQSNSGSNYDWCYVTNKGNAMDLGMFDREHTYWLTLGDYLYIDGSSHLCTTTNEYGGLEWRWHKFHLTENGANVQVVEKKND